MTSRLIAIVVPMFAVFAFLASEFASGARPAWPRSRTPEGRRDETHMPRERDLRQIKAAAPDKAPAKPRKARKVLVWGRVWTHVPNGSAARAIEILGKKTGAITAVPSDDIEMFAPEKLKQFDAVVLNNLHERDPLLPDNFKTLSKDGQAKARARQKVLRKGLLDYVATGGGVVGIHAATAACQKWPEYGAMMGAYYGGHINQDTPMKVEKPDHPINACFGGKDFTIRDEIYMAREPYSRDRLTVLVKLDLSKMDDPGKRKDKDYAVSWVRTHGKGRVFYTSMGHAPQTYRNALFLRHLLAGIQYATGDLKVDAPK